MKIYTLLENTACRPDVQAEHGLSLYVETGEHRILFDAGQSGLFAENAEKMGVDLTKVEMCILSHGHYDHGGGLPRFLEINQTAPVYANARVFEKHYNGTEKNIGLPPILEGNPRIRLVENDLQLAPGLTLSSCNDRAYKAESYGLNCVQNGVFQSDTFLHEQYLLVQEGDRRILFSGCSHKGILNIVKWFQPDILIGGFHFKKLDVEKDKAVLEQAARELLSYKTQYYTCHCTGTAQYDFLKTIMGDRLSYLSCGSILTI